ncbi:MAG: isoleucine--tRNA ligase [Candidatus Moranbacteria bacterium]|nr:isoleucine--tRNA ligase [Candidatus Moranbacteria bacterium]
MFKKVDPKVSFPKMEEEILKYWEDNKIFEKSVSKDAPQGDFVFYEGPPTANGKPGLHHVLARSFKDIIPRYKTMKGYRVARKAGWDTHGLPVELQVEKALGLKNKQDIENIVPGDARASVIEFNRRCKESVWEYRDLWEKLTRRMGYWVDMEHPYVTYENSYIESVWWQIAQIAELKDEKGESLLYRGHKVVPYCYRCGTALSSHEVAQGYQTVKDNSVYVKFEVKEQGAGSKKQGKTYLLAWTTTPWTLPGNVALAVNPSIEYVIREILKGDHAGETYITASERQADVYAYSGIFPKDELKEGENPDAWAKTRIITGKELIGLNYEPLYETDEKNNREGLYRVIAGDFVTTDSGTGVVHIAPAFGEDDANVGRENGLPTLHTVDLEGKVSADVPGKGISVKKKNDKNRYAVDDLIIADLKECGLLFKEEEYEHEYPFCWRCDTPLIYFAKPSWFIAMSAVREELMKNAEAISWVPENIKEGRFGEWLRGIRDWAISRDRYWGTPIPIWECEGQTTGNSQQKTGCGKRKVISSIKELEELSGQKLEDVHKPYIDDVEWTCECGKGTMRRTPEVLDVWFDSGAMPLAQFSYPAGSTDDEKVMIETGKSFPAGFISEAVDQTRGWFYTLHAIATLLHKAGAVPKGNAYDNVICLGHVLDGQGKKMSKSKGNVIDPFKMFDEYGADMLRWALFSVNQPGLPKRFDAKVMRDVQNRVFRMLWNSYSFFMTYASIDDWKPKESVGKSEHILDRWILADCNYLVHEVKYDLDRYDVYSATQTIEKFIDNLSNWYIRRSRNRFWKNENDDDKEHAYQTLCGVLLTLSKLMAPFTPFLSEEIYRNLTGEDSVHLANWPEETELEGGELRKEMLSARLLVTQGLKMRSEAGVKVRQPLSGFSIGDIELRDELKEILADELNVKTVVGGKPLGLDTEITPELRLEGQAREIIRAVQEGRKKAGFNVEDRISLGYEGMSAVFADEILRNLIAGETLAEGGITEGELADADFTESVDLDGEAFAFWLKRGK